MSKNQSIKYGWGCKYSMGHSQVWGRAELTNIAVRDGGKWK
jgi:hypothetical protein